MLHMIRPILHVTIHSCLPLWPRKVRMIPIRIASAEVNNSMLSLAFTVNCSAGIFSEYLMVSVTIQVLSFMIQAVAGAGQPGISYPYLRPVRFHPQ